MDEEKKKQEQELEDQWPKMLDLQPPANHGLKSVFFPARKSDFPLFLM